MDREQPDYWRFPVRVPAGITIQFDVSFNSSDERSVGIYDRHGSGPIEDWTGWLAGYNNNSSNESVKRCPNNQHCRWRWHNDTNVEVVLWIRAHGKNTPGDVNEPWYKCVGEIREGDSAQGVLVYVLLGQGELKPVEIPSGSEQLTIEYRPV
jgi:hypothetical protein